MRNGFSWGVNSGIDNNDKESLVMSAINPYQEENEKMLEFYDGLKEYLFKYLPKEDSPKNEEYVNHIMAIIYHVFYMADMFHFRI